MWPAATIETILRRADSVVEPEDSLGERLVSIVFAPPAAPIWHELQFSVGYLDEQTRDDWDLFFAGVPAVAKVGNPRAGRNWADFFEPRAFREMADAVSAAHRHAISASDHRDREVWRHSGGTDLVSLMVYHGQPDWLTLKAVRLDALGGSVRLALSEVAARQVTWVNGHVDSELSPGINPGHATTQTLRAGLQLVGGALLTIGSGVAGNYVSELLKSLM